MNYTIALLLAASIASVGCNRPTQTYEWGKYESSLYTLMKDPTSLDKYGIALQKQIKNGEESNKVPPGIYAEYGYFLTVTNQPGEAIKYYEKEKQRWPESARLMDKMIMNCKSPKPTQAPPTPTPAAIVAPAPAVVIAPAQVKES
jgi:hypothetical protein